MSYGPPWKLAVIGAVTVTAALALLLVDWTLAQLTAFTGMLLIGRGALHLVTTSLEGASGALSGLLSAAEMAVGATLILWPAPTLLVVAVAVGALTIVRGLIEATIVLGTRADLYLWTVGFVADLVEIALGVTLIARPGSSVEGTAVTLGVVGMVAGTAEIVAAITRKYGPRHVRDSVAVAAVP